MDIWGAFETDTKKVTEGVWLDFVSTPNRDGTVPGFCVAHMDENNPEYAAEAERRLAHLRRDVDAGLMTNALAVPIMRKLFAERILLDWRNVHDKDGNAIEFTKENAEKFLTALPQLYKMLLAEAQKLQNFRAGSIEVTAKN